MRVGSLFSGIGGFDLGLERAGMTIAWQSEIDPYASAVLRKHWPDVPNHGDIRNIRAGTVEPVDVLCGGFPCQDISSSGTKRGIDGPKSGLWREMARVIGELQPRYALMENVTGLLARGLGDVLGDLAEVGYDAEWHCIPASYVGIPQGRDRVWIVAYPGGGGLEGGDERLQERPSPFRWPDDDRLGEAQHRALDGARRTWRMDDGLRGRVDRLRCLGNAIVPQVAEVIGRAVMACH